MKFILGRKIEMTQIYKDNGDVVPVTAVVVEPNIITQIKNQEKDNYTAVQIGFGKPKNIKKPQVGHLKGIDQVKKFKEIKLSVEETTDLKRGDKLTVEIFEAGDKVKVTGVSKGKGFQGVVKRHRFHGSPASHGHKDQLRMPGSIGATDAARVFKGKKMPGRMGNEQVTVTGLEIVEVDAEKNILYVKGAVPGTRNTMLLVSGPGELKIKEAEPQGDVPASDGDKKPEPVVEVERSEIPSQDGEKKVEKPAKVPADKEETK